MKNYANEKKIYLSLDVLEVNNSHSGRNNISLTDRYLQHYFWF